MVDKCGLRAEKDFNSLLWNHFALIVGYLC